MSEEIAYLIVWILSHGGSTSEDQGFVYTSEGQTIEIKKILHYLSAKKLPEMDGKPKLVIILACRQVRKCAIVF